MNADKTTVVLPELPVAVKFYARSKNMPKSMSLYSADQMRAYATAALAQKDGEIERLKAQIEAAYREGFDDGAYCMDESAKPFKYVDADWAKSNARAALGSRA